MPLETISPISQIFRKFRIIRNFRKTLIPMPDEYFMKKALDEAKAAFGRDEVPVGAVVVCKDRIIARAHNLVETLTDVTAHAEMQAVTAAANHLGGK